MSRNMIKYVEKVFSTLSEGIAVPNIKKARLTDPPVEQRDTLFREFLNTEISQPEYLAHDVRFFTAQIDKITLYCLTNFSENQANIQQLASEGIVTVSPSEAIFLATITDASIQRSPSISLNTLEEEVLFQQEETIYTGHNIFDLLPYFESMTFFTVAENSQHSGKEAKDLAYFIASHDLNLINPNLHIFLNQFRDLLSHPGSFMKQNIFWSMTAAHYKHVFLELYRCIENIYSLPHAMALKQKMGLSLASYVIARHCADELGWKRKEESSLIKILKLTPTNTIEPFVTQNIYDLGGTIYTFTTQEDEERSKTSLAKLIYKIRNQMVHQFESDKEISISSEAWIDLIKLLIPIIDHIYTAHAAELPTTPPKVVQPQLPTAT